MMSLLRVMLRNFRNCPATASGVGASASANAAKDFLRLAATQATAVHHASYGSRRLSTSTDSTVPSEIYELRTYRINMVDFKAIVDLFAQYIHMRTNHSELTGFWTAEIGASIHEVVHIWKYDSLSHRFKVRKALSEDKDWNANFLSKLTPKVQYMTNALMAPVPGTSLKGNVEKDPKAVYTLQRLLQASPAPDSSNADEMLIGQFWGILGANNTEYRLWRYGNIDAAVEASWQKTLENAGQTSNILLYPTAFSPLQ